MDLWTIYESFDPVTGDLFLDVVDASARVPLRAGLIPGVLERFPDFREAHAFLEGYVRAMKEGREAFIREVHCGRHQCPGCDIGPCRLGVTPDYRCAYRDRPQPS